MKVIVEKEQMNILIKKERIIYITEMYLDWGIVTSPYEDDIKTVWQYWPVACVVKQYGNIDMVQAIDINFSVQNPNLYIYLVI